MRMIAIGITGGIGSGKSVVASILKSYGYPVFDCDRVAKELYDTDAELKAELISTFGEGLYQTPDTKLNRQALAQIIFNDAEALTQINNLVHPRVRALFEVWRAMMSERGYGICFIESAILLQAGLDKMLSAVVMVDAPEELRVVRVMRRDGAEASAVKQRINKQISSEDLIRSVNFVIENDEKQALLPQIEQLLVKFKLKTL